MTELIRWNTGFIRGLAQSVLDRAKLIRSGLVGYTAAQAEAKASSKTSSKPKRKTAAKKKTTTARKGTPRRRRG